jgi:hypothetical protein
VLVTFGPLVVSARTSLSSFGAEPVVPAVGLSTFRTLPGATLVGGIATVRSGALGAGEPAAVIGLPTI